MAFPLKNIPALVNFSTGGYYVDEEGILIDENSTRSGYPSMDKDKSEASEIWAPPIVDMTDPSAPVAISKACKEIGMFYLENHGIPEETIQHIFKQSKAFFGLDMDVKMAVELDKNYRGYRPLGKEIVNKDNQSKGDTKEAFDIWRDLDPQQQENEEPLRGPNQWPSESSLPGFKMTMKTYFNTMHALSERVMTILANGVNVDPTVFTSSLSDPLSALRIAHYTSEVSNPENGVFGIGEHTDKGCLTMVYTEEPGLQILLNGDWVDVPPRPRALICSVSDMLQIWSNDHLHSPVHRVVNKLGRERYSITFFAVPNFDAEVSCLPQFCSEDDPPKYPTTTGGKFLVERLSRTFFVQDHGKAIVSGRGCFPG